VLLQFKIPAIDVVGLLLCGDCAVSEESGYYEEDLAYVFYVIRTLMGGLLMLCDADQEWIVYRHNRRLHCVDDWKPSPPWHKIDNVYMEYHYDKRIRNQYSYEYAKF
jgi:hypothetical protein